MRFEELDDLYHETILEHRRHPRNSDKLEDPDITADGVNPFCGDEIHIQIALDSEGRVSRVGLQGVGCAINQATGSMLSDAIQGKTLDEVEALSRAFNDLMTGGPHSDGLGELTTLESVRQFPIRIKCALLAWSALDDGIEDYEPARSR
jgi:nitrogen fixation NifU-like protein